MDRLYSRREILGIIGTEIAALGLTSCSSNVQETAKKITNTSTARPTETKTATPIPATSTVTLIPFKFPTPVPSSTRTEAPTATSVPTEVPTIDPEKERADMLTETKKNMENFLKGDFKNYLDPNQKGFFVDRYTKVPYPISYYSEGSNHIKEQDWSNCMMTPLLLGVFRDDELQYMALGATVPKTNIPFTYVITSGFYGTKYPNLNKALVNERHVDKPTWPLMGTNFYTFVKIEWLETILQSAVNRPMVIDTIGYNYVKHDPNFTGLLTKEESDVYAGMNTLENAKPIINAYKGLKGNSQTVFWNSGDVDKIKLEDLKDNVVRTAMMCVNFPNSKK